MKVLLVSPKSTVWNSRKHLPLGLGYLGAVLEGAGHTVTIYDAVVEEESIQDVLDGEMYDLVGITSVGWRTDTRLEVYRQVGRWLADHTPLQATVGTLEVGIIGYHAQRTMVGFAGLIQPDVARQLAVSTTYQDSAAWAIQTYRPDYVVLHGGTFDAIAGSDWFRAGYEFVRDFAGSGTLWMKLYRRSATP